MGDLVLGWGSMSRSVFLRSRVWGLPLPFLPARAEQSPCPLPKAQPDLCLDPLPQRLLAQALLSPKWGFKTKRVLWPLSESLSCLIPNPPHAVTLMSTGISCD